MSVQEMIDSSLKKEQDLRKDRVGSGKFKPSLFGSCFRRHWYAKIGEPETNPTDARGLRVFQSGKLFHDFVQAFYPDGQKEVLIETEHTKGFADLVLEHEVADIKSQHSDAFWYMQRNIVCTLDDGKVVRFNESDIKGDKVWYYKKERTILKKTVLSILDEKINNWLQVAWYAKQLKKPTCRLVFVSKDDLCIAEYVFSTEKLMEKLDIEENLLYTIKTLPPPVPRLYGGKDNIDSYSKLPKECSYCNHLDKCKADKCKSTITT